MLGWARKLRELGVLGMAVPQAYGGSGLSILDTVLVLEEIGKVCYVTAMAALGEVGVQTRIIATYAPESIKQKILPRVASGDAILAICMTEPDAGTDVPNYRTNCEIKGDRVMLKGDERMKAILDGAGRRLQVIDPRTARVSLERVERPGAPGAQGVAGVPGAPRRPGTHVAAHG